MSLQGKRSVPSPGCHHRVVTDIALNVVNVPRFLLELGDLLASTGSLRRQLLLGPEETSSRVLLLPSVRPPGRRCKTSVPPDSAAAEREPYNTAESRQLLSRRFAMFAELICSLVPN
jgi:hypothetical protein